MTVETILGIGILVGVVTMFVLFQKAAGAATSKLNRSLRRGAHSEGQRLVKTSLNFKAPVPPDVALATISRSINAYPSAPAVMPGLYERKLDAETRAFIFGSKVQEVFTGILVCQSSGSGTEGQYQIARWSEGDGIVGRRSEMMQVRERIEKAVRELGGECSANE